MATVTASHKMLTLQALSSSLNAGIAKRGVFLRPRVTGRNFGCPLAVEQCQVVVFIADDLGFLGPGSPDLMTELCPPQELLRRALK